MNCPSELLAFGFWPGLTVGVLLGIALTIIVLVWLGREVGEKTE